MSEPELPTGENVNHAYRADMDDDDDQLNSSHKIRPNVHQSMTPVTNKLDAQLSHSPPTTQQNEVGHLNNDFRSLFKTDLNKYLHTAFPRDYAGFAQCHIKREKGISTIFSLYLNGQNENDQVFLLAARKPLTIGGHAEFFIGTDANASKNLNEENSIAKLRGINITGSEYILYHHQHSKNEQIKQQSMGIAYDEHIFGSKEPRKLTVVLRDTNGHVNSPGGSETILDEWRSGRSTDLVEIKNKKPTYDEDSKTYSINVYGNGIKQPSHKNFQLIIPNQNHEDDIIMQFGRIDEQNFALDYRYPLTATQAFAIALSAFHSRFRT